MQTERGEALRIEEMREIVDQRAYDNDCVMKLCVDVVLYYAGGFKGSPVSRVPRTNEDRPQPTQRPMPLRFAS